MEHENGDKKAKTETIPDYYYFKFCGNKQQLSQTLFVEKDGMMVLNINFSNMWNFKLLLKNLKVHKSDDQELKDKRFLLSDPIDNITKLFQDIIDTTLPIKISDIQFYIMLSGIIHEDTSLETYGTLKYMFKKKYDVYLGWKVLDYLYKNNVYIREFYMKYVTGSDKITYDSQQFLSFCVMSHAIQSLSLHQLSLSYPFIEPPKNRKNLFLCVLDDAHRYRFELKMEHLIKGSPVVEKELLEAVKEKQIFSDITMFDLSSSNAEIREYLSKVFNGATEVTCDECKKIKFFTNFIPQKGDHNICRQCILNKYASVRYSMVSLKSEKDPPDIIYVTAEYKGEFGYKSILAINTKENKIVPKLSNMLESFKSDVKYQESCVKAITDVIHKKFKKVIICRGCYEHFRYDGEQEEGVYTCNNCICMLCLKEYKGVFPKNKQDFKIDNLMFSVCGECFNDEDNYNRYFDDSNGCLQFGLHYINKEIKIGQKTLSRRAPLDAETIEPMKYKQFNKEAKETLEHIPVLSFKDYDGIIIRNCLLKSLSVCSIINYECGLMYALSKYFPELDPKICSMNMLLNKHSIGYSGGHYYSQACYYCAHCKKVSYHYFNYSTPVFNRCYGVYHNFSKICPHCNQCKNACNIISLKDEKMLCCKVDKCYDCQVSRLTYVNNNIYRKICVDYLKCMGCKKFLLNDFNKLTGIDLNAKELQKMNDSHDDYYHCIKCKKVYSLSSFRNDSDMCIECDPRCKKCLERNKHECSVSSL